MKKILCALYMLFSFVVTAEAANRNQYSQQYSYGYDYSNPLEEIFGNGSEWYVTPQVPQPNRLRGRYRQYLGFNPPQQHQERRYSYRPSPSVAYTNQDYGVSSSIVTYGRMLQSAGYRVSEHPAFGGVHHVHHGWAHYAGRAIDVNVGYGTKEAFNPATRARFDAIAAQARAAGYTVLWRVAGHYDHIHIQR